MESQSQRVARIPTQAIMAHRLIPGAKLGERELGEIFSVSRAVIRQAPIRLAEDGLVDLERHRGGYVAKPSLREALEIHEALILFEQGIVSQLVNRLNPAVLAQLGQHLKRQQHALEAQNKELADHLGHEFHSLLVRLGEHRVLQEIHTGLSQRVTLLRALYRSNFDYCVLINDHAETVKLLEKGRIKPLQELIESHYQLVLRGYLLEETAQRAMPAREALEPYLTLQETKGAAAS